MNKNTIQKIIIWTVLFLFLLNSTLAIGIRPAKTMIVSEETYDRDSKFWVVNDDKREFTAQVYLEGEMGDYVNVKTSALHFREDDDALPIEFEIHLPEEVPPGESTAYIVVEEKVEGKTPDTITSKIILKHKIIVQGPYPDKYVTVKLNFHEDANSVRMVSEVQNLGKEDIGNIQTKFYVNDKSQQQHVLESPTTTLAVQENKLLDARVDKTIFDKGEYEVSAVTTYDDQKIEIIKELRVGRPDIDITYFDKFFIANKINEYSLDLLNRWNKEVKNVFVDVEVKKDNQKIDEFRTRSVDVEGLATKRLNDYFNAQGKAKGKYTFDMTVNFWDTYRSDTKTFEADIVSEDEFKDLPANVAGAASGWGSSSTMILVLVIGVLLGIIGFYVFWRYKRRDEYEGGGSVL